MADFFLELYYKIWDPIVGKYYEFFINFLLALIYEVHNFNLEVEFLIRIADLITVGNVYDGLWLKTNVAILGDIFAIEIEYLSIFF